MFQLKTKDKYLKCKFYFNLFYFSLFVPYSIFLGLVLLIYQANNEIISRSIFEKILFVSSFVLMGLAFFYSITSILIKRMFLKKIVKEHLEVLSKTKMPAKLPKVIYVYTTHNDFMPSRMLQNMKQTYKNIEYWISDGSSNDDISNEVSEFAKTHNVNLFKMAKPSKDKSDNLNSFLKHIYEMNNDFEYIVTSDSDVAFCDSFVETALKYFYSEKSIRLGFVNTLLIDYYGNNFYNNSLADIETILSFHTPIVEQVDDELYSHLYGACSIVNIKFLKEVNNGYFFDVYEDWYTRINGEKSMWKGITSPLIVSKQSMEKEVFPTIRRYMRYFDWRVKYFKTSTFNNISDEHSKSYFEEFSQTIMYLPNLILKFILLTFWIVIFMFNVSYSKNIGFIVIQCSFVVFAFVKLIDYLFSLKLIKPIKFIFAMMVWPFWIMSRSLSRSMHWFKSVVQNKIIGFTPTRSIEKNSKKTSNWRKIKWYLVSWIVTSLILSVLIFTIVYFDIWNKQKWLFGLVTFVLVITSYISIGNLSTVILFLFSFIKVNKNYSDDDFILFNNKVVNFQEIKDKFYTENPDVERFC